MSTGSFNVGAPPTLNLSGVTSICEGQSTTLLAGGANTYIWNNTTTSPFITVSPAATTSYSLAGFNSVTSCSNSANITVTVVPQPTLSVSGQTAICLGDTAVLFVSGANSDVWNTGSNLNSISVSPTVNTTYSVTGTSALASCSSTQSILIKLSSCSILGINESVWNSLISVYPNPTLGKINLESGTAISFEVYDALGRLITEQKKSITQFSFDLIAYPDGIYFLKVYNKTNTKTLKLVKSN